MTELRKQVEMAVLNTYAHFEILGKEDYGVASVYTGDGDDSFMIHIVGLDGSCYINEYILALEKFLPEGLEICNNSPTDGTIMLFNLGKDAKAFNPRAHLDLFKSMFLKYLANHNSIRNSATRITFAYLDTLLARTGIDLEELFLELNPNEEVLPQLLTLG